jgi:hypothetical protein
MNEIILPCCGESIPGPPGEVACPSCGTPFTGEQVEGFQLKELTSIPVVDVLHAARMLGRPPDWVGAQRQLFEPIYGALSLDFVFPLTAIRRFAREQGLALTPLPIENGLLWVNRPGHRF